MPEGDRSYLPTPEGAESLGKTIQSECHKKNIRLTELIDALEINELKLGQLLRNETSLDDSTAEKLTEVLGKSKEFWFEQERRHQAFLRQQG